jgi:hypothetical protein
MWTTESRARYNRDHLRYPSDTTDEEWTEMAALIPPARGTQADCEYPGSSQWAVICLEYGLSVAGDSQRFSAAQYHLLLLWTLGSGWDVAAAA